MIAANQPSSVPGAKRQVLNRLRRAQGQLNAAIAAIEADADCRTVVTQLSASASAISRAGFVIVVSNMERCLVGDAGMPTDDDPHDLLPIEELEKLFMMLK